ncbi:hypothetical protein BH23THE1_BH23THE1_06280 [soil metagenome]
MVLGDDSLKKTTSLITNELIGIENLSSFENVGNTEIVLTNSGPNKKN